jgi:hypothetical protein
VDVAAALILGGAAASTLALSVGCSLIQSFQDAGFMAVYYAGGLLALEATLRVAARR